MLRAFVDICKDIDSDDPDLTAGIPACPDLSKLICPTCKAKAVMVNHGHYQRHLVGIKDGQPKDNIIRVIRLRCLSCGTTHAFLPVSAIPYCGFSIRFIARMITDWTTRFTSIEDLCQCYQISVNTFYRLKQRFLCCVRIAYGITSDGTCAVRMAYAITSSSLSVLSDMLQEYFLRTGISFCQGRGP